MRDEGAGSGAVGNARVARLDGHGATRLLRAELAIWHLRDPWRRDPAAWERRARAYLDAAEAQATAAAVRG